MSNSLPASAPLSFPKNFLWGCATAAFQVEGHPLDDGAGESIWTQFCRKPGSIFNSDTADVTANQYEHWKEDVALMKALGIQAYRFSLSWSRILPNAAGKINSKGVDYYNRLIDELLNNGITPFVTIYHWDLPASLQEQGGWLNPDTARKLGEFAECAAKCFSDRVKNFFTTNEISSFCYSGYQDGVHAPGLKLSRKEVAQVVKNGCLGHGYAALGLRNGARQPVRIGYAENPIAAVPIIATQEHIDAARKAFRIWNGPITTLLEEGKYPAEYLQEMGKDAPSLTDEEAKIICTPTDVRGINLYSGAYIEAAPDAPNGFRNVGTAPDHPGAETLAWLRVVPEALYWGLRFCRESWGNKPTFVSENGYSSLDNVTQQGTIDDTGRLMLLRNTLTHLQRGVTEGIDVRGYMHWSFIDNFEWSWGYKCRFGLVRCDFPTGRRTPKLSAKYYSQVIRHNAVL